MITVKDARQKRVLLEQDLNTILRDKLRAFRRETGLEVSAITVSFNDRETIESAQVQYFIADVKVTVNL